MKPARGASGRFCVKQSTSKRSRGIAISFGQRQRSDMRPERNGGSILRCRSRSLRQAARNQGDPWEEVIAPGWRLVSARRSRKCWIGALTSRKGSGHRATRTAWVAVCVRWAGSDIVSVNESASNGAGGGLTVETVMRVLRLVPSLFRVN
jgi:hypothetical protein